MKNGNPVNILVRLPAKLGDTILAMAFLYALKKQFPDSSIYVVIQGEFCDLTYFMPMTSGHHAFNKREYKGINGVKRFGKEIKEQRHYDIFFCLPYSFSSALIGFFAGIKTRIGLNIEHRWLLFTHSYKIPPGINFADEFLLLLERYTGNIIEKHSVYYDFKEEIQVDIPSEKYIVLNVNSGEQSRTIPSMKAASLIQAMNEHFDCDILLVGSPKERERLDQIISMTGDKPYVKNIAGDYPLDKLGWILHKAQCVLSTDSGLAHFANHVGAPTVVIFGAADDSHTRPYNTENLAVLKKTELPCLPCKKGVCKFGDPLCITELSNHHIIVEMKELMQKPHPLPLSKGEGL